MDKDLIMRLGAKVRLEEIRSEEKSILAEFPSLRSNGEAKVAPAFKPRRRKMSAAARKAIGDAQRKRWAVQKAQAAEKEKAAPKRGQKRG